MIHNAFHFNNWVSLTENATEQERKDVEKCVESERPWQESPKHFMELNEQWYHSKQVGRKLNEHLQK